MNFWNHRSIQDRLDLTALKEGTIRDDETPPEEMDRSRLSPRQLLALKAFHSGSSLADAAKAAGVSRKRKGAISQSSWVSPHVYGP
jgi:hypothetical protein